MEFKDFRTLLFSTSFVLACINVSIIAILSDLNYNSTCLSVSHLICKLFVNRYAKKKNYGQYHIMLFAADSSATVHYFYKYVYFSRIVEFDACR